MREYKLMERTDRPEIKFWAREVSINGPKGYAANFPVFVNAYEVKYPRKMYTDAKDVPAPELCVWSGYLQAAAVRKHYRETDRSNAYMEV